ncbi:glandular kallikrein-7, submandibular/renal [Phlebotomus papatasi]|uniref:glandular kallikrein-7, submandibular/renal n=1 Tax=Phlebotomus papatasi TaxID=29031 RepID=UPI002483E7DE|nr:glandular kallikrein-7, submandibular/renal [Phlebotomus papatasi]
MNNSNTLLFFCCCSSFLILIVLINCTNAGDKFNSDSCGIQPLRRQPRDGESSKNRSQNRARRKGRIISGNPTEEGEYPWQVSLELLHPSLGFLGHWCGAVLVDANWILSAAHCVHNDLFNLPLPAFWTAVLGEHDRSYESGWEQRIPIDKIVMHNNYQNYQHDLVLMRLSRPADIHHPSFVRPICLPSHTGANAYDEGQLDDRDDNFLRRLFSLYTKKPSRKSQKRRNDKFFQDRHITNRENNDLFYGFKTIDDFNLYQQNPLYQDCRVTGWGKKTIEGELTDILLQSRVPILSNAKCQQAYGDHIKIHEGHICGGKLEKKAGAPCVGDSGGGLQCREGRSGPWILVGLTSFGWNCSLKLPDVFTRISYYVKWINDVISSDFHEDLYSDYYF